MIFLSIFHHYNSTLCVTSRPRIFKNEDASVNTYHSIETIIMPLNYILNENITIILSNNLLLFYFLFVLFHCMNYYQHIQDIIDPFPLVLHNYYNLLLLPN